MKKVLITGASGFIGKKTGEYFAKNGYEVMGWDRSPSHESFPIATIDMHDEDKLNNVLKVYKPEIIIHCAGSADVGKSVIDPNMDYESNVTVTHNLLFALYKCGINDSRLIFLSSASVYGNPNFLPISEDTPLNPLSPYAVHKVMCEELCKYFSSNYAIDVKIARIFSAYGIGLKKQIFWDMFKKYKNTGRLDMYGTGYESRDYIYIDDVVSALYLLATSKSNQIVFNIANGQEITIRKATELFADNMHIEKKNIFFNGTIREGEPLNWEADISRISGLGYKNTVEIENGINLYCDWVRTL